MFYGMFATNLFMLQVSHTNLLGCLYLWKDPGPCPSRPRKNCVGHSRVQYLIIDTVTAKNIVTAMK